jgi:hypothetical protein
MAVWLCEHIAHCSQHLTPSEHWFITVCIYVELAVYDANALVLFNALLKHYVALVLFNSDVVLNVAWLVELCLSPTFNLSHQRGYPLRFSSRPILFYG